MPLLMCPNCHGSMQTVNRKSVEFDMCPSCRGIWLDRGELEKLMAMDRAPDAEESQAVRLHQPEPVQRDRVRVDYDDDDDDDRRRYQQQGGQPYRKKRGFDLFDIFD